MTAHDDYVVVNAAAGAAEAASRVHGCLDEALEQLKAARTEVDSDTAISLDQLASSVRQANDVTARFKRLYLKLPGVVSELKATAPSVGAAVRRLKAFRHDFVAVLGQESSVEFQLSVAEKYFTDVLDPGHRVEPRRWRDLRKGAAENVTTARSNMKELSQRSVEVLRALGYEKDLKGVGKL